MYITLFTNPCRERNCVTYILLRWHHSRSVAHSNSNYGENLVLVDHVFGTFYLEEVEVPCTLEKSGTETNCEQNSTTDSVNSRSHSNHSNNIPVERRRKRSVSRRHSKKSHTKQQAPGSRVGAMQLQLGRVRYSDPVFVSQESSTVRKCDTDGAAAGAAGAAGPIAIPGKDPKTIRKERTKETRKLANRLVRLPKSLTGQMLTPFTVNPLFTAWQERPSLAEFPRVLWEVLCQSPAAPA